MKNLLSSQNLDIKNKTGISLADVCGKALATNDFFKELKYLFEQTVFRTVESSDSISETLTKNIQKGLIDMCTSEAVINSLQQGLERGIAFKSHWIIGNKYMKTVIREATEKIVYEYSLSLEKNKTVAQTKLMVLAAFQIGLTESAPILHHREFLLFIARNYRHMDRIKNVSGRLKILKKHYTDQGVVEHLHHIISRINALKDPSVMEKGLAVQKSVGNRFRNSLLTFSLQKLQENVDPKILCTICDFFQNFFEKEIILYLHPNYDNDANIINAVFQATVRGQIKLHVLTCPDYSGFVDKDDLWNFDFKNLNGGEGVVARKSYDVVSGLYHSFKVVGITANIVHDLPFFEFKNGFQGEAWLSTEEVREKLKQSLSCIQQHYDTASIPAQTRSTEEIIENESFFSRSDSVARDVITPMLSDNKDFQKFFEETFRKRYGIYSAWFPQGAMLDDEYMVFLRKKLVNQLAEYYTDTELYHDGKSMLVFADSPQMSYAYSFWNIPAVCGHGKNAQQYVG